MRINQDFGMSVQTILFLKNRNTSEFLQAGEIAKTLDFSVGYLQKVVQTLSKYGIVECKRGRIGGIRLRAKTITLFDIWKATCGDINIIDPSLNVMKKPLKAFADSMKEVVIYKKDEN
ncbi:MAG: Rrf2 family transcriptional regulator [Sedimentisphaerales bacterium]|nr:Rrf2 family transcriptional regulator [Sedimentisphaerales bacterium]